MALGQLRRLFLLGRFGLELPGVVDRVGLLLVQLGFVLQGGIAEHRAGEALDLALRSLDEGAAVGLWRHLGSSDEGKCPPAPVGPKPAPTPHGGGADVASVTPRVIGPATGRERLVRIGRNVEVRPLGGGAGCLVMLAVSLFLSVGLTLLVNLGR